MFILMAAGVISCRKQLICQQDQVSSSQKIYVQTCLFISQMSVVYRGVRVWLSSGFGMFISDRQE